MQTDVAVVIVNWNGWRDTIRCIETVLQLPEDVDVFICDNASADQSVDHILAWGADKLVEVNELRARTGRRSVSISRRGPVGEASKTDDQRIWVIETGANLGFAGGNNVGLQLALLGSYEFFWLINNDTEVDHLSLSPLIARMRSDGSIGICGSTLVYWDHPEVIQTLGGGGFKDLTGQSYAIGAGQALAQPIDRKAVEAEMRFVSGAAMLVSRSFLENIGLMQEDYFLYYEELDWAERARPQYRLGYEPASIVYHKVGASIGTHDAGNRSLLSEYYLSRNRMKFCSRFAKSALLFTVAELAFNILKFGSRGDMPRARTVARALFGFPLKKTSA